MNINRDYLIINDVKKSNIKLDNGSMFFYITDKNTQNIFVNLVINVSNNDLIQKYANIENAEDYALTMNIVKPDNTYKIVEGKLHDKEKAIFEFDLEEDCVDKIGTYKCELLTKCSINEQEEITTSNSITYKVKKSVLNDLDDIVEAPEYPLVIQLFDKLSDIEQYEEDRRANELARQLAEQQRQTRFNVLDADITNSIEAIDNKVVDVENRISAKEEAIDTLIAGTKADIDNYKVAKDQEIDEYKALKDTEINEAITNQDNKIDTAITSQNDKIKAVQNNDAVQNNKLDTLQNKVTIHEERITATEVKNTEQDNRLDIIENTNTQQNSRLTTIEDKNVEQDNRLNTIEAIDVAQNTRLNAIEAKNTEQDNRLLDIEKVNKRQDMDLKCLFAESKNNMIDVTEEGNSIYLQNSTVGYTLIDEIQGNTMVNCNKEADKELILNGNINTNGYSNITLNKGVNGGLVDVALEGNTMVNVCNQKDPVAITKSYTVETGNHVALQGEYDGKCRPVVTGNTLVNVVECKDELVKFTKETTWGQKRILSDLFKPNTTYSIFGEIDVITEPTNYSPHVEFRGNNNASGQNVINTSKNFNTFTTPDDITGIHLRLIVTGSTASIGSAKFNLVVLEGDYTNKPIPEYFTGLQSSFEDKVVTQEMIDNGEELAENLGKYKADYVISREDGTIGQTKTFYLNTPLLEGDTIEQQGDNVVHVHRSELRAYQTDDELTLPTDMTNTLVAKPSPTYEVISQNDTILCDSYVNGHLDVDSVVPIERVDFLHFEEELTYLYVDTQYTVQFVSNAVSKVDITLGGTKLLNQDVVLGINKYTITTPSELIDNNLVLNGEGFNASNIVITEATDQEFGYFEGMKSVGECEDNVIEIVSQNKNLFDGIFISGNVAPNGEITSYADRVVTPNYLKINPNVPLFIHGFDNIAYICYYDSDKNVIVRNTYSKYDRPSVHNVPSNAMYIRISIIECTDTSLPMMVEQGSSTEGYTPHQSNAQTLTHEPLRAVGDIKDKYVLIDGKWYIERNCGYRNNYSICDAWSNENLTNRRLKLFKLDNSIEEFNDMNALRKVKSNKFKCVQYGYMDGRFNVPFLAYITENGNLWVSADINYTQQDMLNYINDCQFVYELQTPTYEPINYNPFTVYSDITHISNNSTIPCNMTIKNTGYNCLLKPNTTYTVSSNLGLNTVTTPSVLSEDCLRFYDTDTSDITTMNNVMVLEGDYTTGKPIPSHFPGIESCFEQEYDEVVGKYKVKIRVQNEDASKENYIEFYINEPLRGIGNVKDKVYVKNDKVVVERNCEQRAYQDGDFGTYLTDKVNTVYPLAEPTYEEVEYNDVKLFIESFKNSTLFYNSNIPVTSKVWYSYSVPIVDTVAQTANVTDQQDSMIIDLATQVAVMEMMLM